MRKTQIPMSHNLTTVKMTVAVLTCKRYSVEKRPEQIFWLKIFHVDTRIVRSNKTLRKTIRTTSTTLGFLWTNSKLRRPTDHFASSISDTSFLSMISFMTRKITIGLNMDRTKRQTYILQKSSLYKHLQRSRITRFRRVSIKNSREFSMTTTSKPLQINIQVFNLCRSLNTIRWPGMVNIEARSLVKKNHQATRR